MKSDWESISEISLLKMVGKRLGGRKRGGTIHGRPERDGVPNYLAQSSGPLAILTLRDSVPGMHQVDFRTKHLNQYPISLSRDAVLQNDPGPHPESLKKKKKSNKNEEYCNKRRAGLVSGTVYLFLFIGPVVKLSNIFEKSQWTSKKVRPVS